MPRIVSIELGTCEEDGAGSSPTVTGFLVQEVYDASGTGELDWTKNGGVFPNDLENNVRVFSNGNRLSYIAEYTITPLTTPTSSRVTILNPIPNQYYIIEAYYG